MEIDNTRLRQWRCRWGDIIVIDSNIDKSAIVFFGTVDKDALFVHLDLLFEDSLFSSAALKPFSLVRGALGIDLDSMSVLQSVFELANISIFLGLVLDHAPSIYARCLRVNKAQVFERKSVREKPGTRSFASRVHELHSTIVAIELKEGVVDVGISKGSPTNYLKREICHCSYQCKLVTQFE